MLMLVGCSNTANIKPVNRNISFTAEMTYYNEYYEMMVEIDESGNTTIKITHPDEIKNLVFEFKDGKVTSLFNGIECDVSDSYKTTAVNFIYTAFHNEKQIVYKNKDRIFAKGKCDGGEYTLYLTEAGLPLKICDSLNRFEIIINNLTINKEK